ncbi:HAD family hydrolase [Lutimonas zeaxanthinifaciens]|uniref:HAD family hydrolase n=1 Tax=Lutimonas zeaxanthinifaciens TaxID=3060215 RepID=UPI00265CB02C|nr:HAD family hydrolase [Lutimonas sp. YSD2104]WKK67413.1 HAD family hydrolase [Lutimonas sp. YSD2104]
MDLSRVKLVVSDMDGTLLNSKSEVSLEFFKLFDALQAHKVHFVAASGRQYTSIHEKLSQISEQITIVAENGGYIRQGNKELGSIHLTADRVKDLLPVLKASEGLYYVVCGKNSAYIDQNEPRFTTILKEYYTRYTVVEDLTNLPDDQVFKVAVYHFESSERYIYPVVKHLEDSYQIKISGSNWVDISDPGANKGRAVKLLQDTMGVSKEETMVFGDFNNDLEMIDQAFFSYAMENAHDNVKKAAKFRTKSNNDSGVELILKELIKAKERGDS